MTNPSMPTSGDNSPPPTNEIRDLRALLGAVLDAITLPHDTPDYEARLLERAGIARAMRGALDENPADLGLNADWLRARLAAEEKQAAKRGERR